jgi:SHS2 domain-containing protein
MRGPFYDKTVVHGEVKAVTYSEMDIQREDGRVVAQVAVDLQRMKKWN